MSEDDFRPARPARPVIIHGLVPSLPERGKIKIGRKGQTITSRGGKEFQPPEKLDHFMVTTLERDPTGNFKRDDAIHAKLGDKPREIPIRLLYDDPTLNFPSRYACYAGRVLWCSGDGRTAQRLADDGTKTYNEVKCPCHRSDPDYQGRDRCKMNGSLSALIDGAGGIGGVWRFRTTSYNTIVGLLSSLAFIRSITGGPLANIPLRLRLQPKLATAPEGQQLTVYVVSIEFAGDIHELQQVGHQIALERAKAHVGIEMIEDEARRLLLSAPSDVPLLGDDNEEIVAEFYPEQAEEEAPPPPKPNRQQAKAKAEKVKMVTLQGVHGDILSWPVTDAAAAMEKLLFEARDIEGGPAGIWETNEQALTGAIHPDQMADLLNYRDELIAQQQPKKAETPPTDPFWAQDSCRIVPKKAGRGLDWDDWRDKMMARSNECVAAGDIKLLHRLMADNEDLMLQMREEEGMLAGGLAAFIRDCEKNILS